MTEQSQRKSTNLYYEKINMDLKDVIYNAARDGKIKRLRVFLEHRDKSDLEQLVNSEVNNATPLVVACKNGHYDVAEYLIKRCGANTEIPGAVTYDNDTIESAPPLWCAAAAGHVSIVRLLVKHGALVNSTTNTSSTPLRAACFDGHYEIVQFLVQHGANIEAANKPGHTCLMIACFRGYIRIVKYLLDNNVDVNRKSLRGNTALHDCAESGHLDIFLLLLEHGARMLPDANGTTPILTAAVTGHTSIVEYLIEQTHLISRKERIDALELLAATYVDRKRDMIGALDLWKRAMQERFDKQPIMPKPISASPIKAYNYSREVLELDALDDLLIDPDEMRMQALLIRERILGPAHPETYYYIRYRGAIYANSGKFENCINLWNYALDMQQMYLEPLDPMTLSSLFSLVEIFNFMDAHGGKHSIRGSKVPLVSVQDVILVFKKAVSEIKFGKESMKLKPKLKKDCTYLNRALSITLNLACFLAQKQLDEESEEYSDTYMILQNLVRINAKGYEDRDVLQLIFSKDMSLVSRHPGPVFPSVKLAKALIKAGCNVHSRDSTGNTALHLAAQNHPWRINLAITLLEGGSHIDAINNAGETFEDILLALTCERYYESINPLKYTTLACLAARIVRKTININYIPRHLQEFVLLH